MRATGRTVINIVLRVAGALAAAAAASAGAFVGCTYLFGAIYNYFVPPTGEKDLGAGVLVVGGAFCAAGAIAIVTFVAGLTLPGSAKRLNHRTAA